MDQLPFAVVLHKAVIAVAVSRYFENSTSPCVEWVPLPSEMRERMAMVQWLRRHGMNIEPWATAIMIYETPSFKLTQALVSRYGIDEAKRRLLPYIAG